uniref:Oxidored_FMN domain-containing protein n=1 Tax=Panagrellus redivivus TaxID=6233 RepID=A0A7E4VEX4_PANRE
MSRRFPIKATANPAKLAESITFPTSKKTARNRIMKAALTERVATWNPEDPLNNGIPTQELCNMYEKYSHGGYGMLISGNTCIDPIHLETAGNVIIHESIDSPQRRAAFKQYAAAFKADPKNLAIVQLNSGGRQTPLAYCEHPIAPSDIQLTDARGGIACGKPRALETDEIKPLIIDNFVYAAKYVYEAGFDGVQIHVAHGFLLAQFLSERINNRTDRYGGSLENRARIVLEIYEAIREIIPAETGFIIGLKVTSADFDSGDVKVDDALWLCKEFERIGYDFIEFGGGANEVIEGEIRAASTIKRDAFYLEVAKQLRSSLDKIILYFTGGFRTVHGMVSAVESGLCDGVGIGGPTASEFDLPAKILSGQVQSAIFNPWNQDYGLRKYACNTQMWQAQQTPYDPNVDINAGLLDVSDEAAAEKYKKALLVYFAKISEANKKSLPVHGVFEYQDI